MRILQVITLSELGGAQTVVINLANILANFGNEVIVAAGEGDGKMFKELDASVKPEHLPSLVRRLSPVNEFKTIMEMRRLYQKYHPDVIHLHSSKAGMLGRIAFPRHKVVYTVHGFDSIRIAYRKFLPLEKLLQRRCAAIVGVSRYDECNLRAEGITHNVSMVYNGIAMPREPESNPMSNIKGFKGKVLCIARMASPKNYSLYIKVAKRLPDIAFIWIGNMEPPAFDYPDNMFFLGNIQGAGSYIRYADIFMLPSNYEGLPMVIIEALANGTPVIASDVGGISELLDGKNGYAIENDAYKMAAKVEEIISLTQKDRQKMVDNAIATYQRLFTVELMVEGYLKIYNQVHYKKL